MFAETLYMLKIRQSCLLEFFQCFQFAVFFVFKFGLANLANEFGRQIFWYGDILVSVDNLDMWKLCQSCLLECFQLLIFFVSFVFE